ncbi:hypothetical protein [Mycolicibacterium sp. XJ1819]
MRPSLYAKVLNELDLVPVAPEQTNAESPVGMVWKPWIYGSHYDLYDQLAAVGGIRPHIHLMNLTRFDDDKARIQQVFECSFGYPLGIDPTNHLGPAVTKSRVNGQHDGAIVMCPIDEVNPEAVYQLPIDNLTGDGYVEDIRVSVLAYAPEICYLKYRPVADRFSNINAYARLGSVHDLFSRDELAHIGAFAHEAGLECGEVDVLRDRKKSQIYIVDANNTPYGPPNHLDAGEAKTAVRALAGAFARAYL